MKPNIRASQIIGSIIVGIREELEFKANFLLLLLGLPVKIGILWLIWDFSLANNSANYDLNQTQLYIFVSITIFLEQIYNQVQNTFVMQSELIGGKAVVNMTLPIQYNRIKFYEQLGIQGILLAIGSIALALGILSNKINLDVPTMIIVLFVIATSVISSFLLISSLSALSIRFGWMNEFWYVLYFFLSFFGGLIIPLALFPDQLIIIAYINPFSNFFDLPASLIISGIDNLKLIALRLLGLVFWVIVFYFIQKTLWKSSLELFTAPGE